MKMTFRWYGSHSDPIPLKYVKQIPGMTGLMGLLDKPAGVVWEEDEIRALVDEVHAAGLELELSVRVELGEDLTPEAVTLTGAASPLERQRLTDSIAGDLGIGKEAVIWIDPHQSSE